jgi:uncharacterized protein (TIGR00369 family)
MSGHPFIPDRETVHDVLGVRTLELSGTRVVLELDVTSRVHQPFGLLHGGVSALLAEGAASLGATISVAPDFVCVGTELNISHLRAVTEGTLRAVATPFRQGRTVQVWGIELRDGNDRLISVARCSLQVVAAPRE